MMAAPLPRARRRRLTRLLKRVTVQNEPTTQADAKFFARRPDRQYRIRQASLAELETIRLTHGARKAADGLRWYVAVRQIAPGIRLRLYTLGLADLDCDQPEEVCRWAYEQAQSASASKIERSLVECLGVRS